MAKVAVKEYFPRELAGRAKGAREVSVYEGHYKQIFEYGLEKFLGRLLHSTVWKGLYG